MPFLWLRVATVLYGVGLIHAFLMLRQRGERSGRVAAPAVAVGMVFHFVSLVESAAIYGFSAMFTIRHAESALAFLIAFICAILYLRYRTSSPAAFIFPLIFVLTFSAAIAEGRMSYPSPAFRSGWIIFHVALLLIGYAMLFLSFVSSLLYLTLSSQLKRKQTPWWALRLPSLAEIDYLGYRALLLGFPFMTTGLMAGVVAAQVRFGPTYFTDPKVVLSTLMWGIYLVLLYARWSSGWRGRRAAYLAAIAFIVAVCAWGANYISRLHGFIAP